MEATALADDGVPRKVSWRQGGRPVRVLPVAGVFGPNGSGKSNVLKAMSVFRNHVLLSFRSGDPGGGIPRRPFRLDKDSTARPSRFEVDLVLNGVRHEYGVIFDDERVLKEWAYRYPRGRSALLFRRESGKPIELGAGNRSVGRAVEKITRPNAFFLSAAAAAGHPDLLPLFQWFEDSLLLAEASSRQVRWAYTTHLLRHERSRDLVLALIRAADLGIANVRIRPLDPQVVDRVRRAAQILSGREEEAEAAPDVDLTELGLVLTHQGGGDDIDFDVSEESLGTLVWLGLIGPVVAALERGSVLLADELEASLHPMLVQRLVELFQDQEANTNGAQLIFSSHDVSLLDDTTGHRRLGRDQIWFTEKLADGNSRLYPLSDLGPRREEAIGKRYLAGLYGATPIVNRAEFVEVAQLIATGEHG
ncbi:AAA family ATPase [Nonomuraea antri]|uniref:AAA family ATPase n=1 Tax=Nonomuraea antri TaxID=2730852 RepID=UPI0022A8B529|nr:ATP-binding protein [Nonomuraea antri]